MRGGGNPGKGRGIWGGGMNNEHPGSVSIVSCYDASSDAISHTIMLYRHPHFCFQETFGPSHWGAGLGDLLSVGTLLTPKKRTIPQKLAVTRGTTKRAERGEGGRAFDS